MREFIGVDIGTSSSKGVRVGADGSVLQTAYREHTVDRPASGRVEMSPQIWWDEFCSIARELGTPSVAAVGVSGMGPCVALTDAAGRPLRPAILYGVDTRARDQIERLTKLYGSDAILERCGSTLSSQSAGPKIAWISDNEPAVFAGARRFFMPASWLAWNLTGEYVLDHHSASQCTPLYDVRTNRWWEPWARPILGRIELPRLVWADSVVGRITSAAALATGLSPGIPVVAGSIDAWTEAISVGATRAGDLMLMYGTTMFLIATVNESVSAPPLWGTVGALEGTRSLAAGMATSGAITGWLRDLFGSPEYSELLAAAEVSPVGARGLLMLPYFAGERTPFADPDARGVIAGLTVGHDRGDLYRSALEATAMGVRDNVEAMGRAGVTAERAFAVGGGTQSDLWMQIVSDVSGLGQRVPRVTIGASFGAAYLAASSLGPVDIEDWNPIDREVRPEPARRRAYDELFELYVQLHASTRDIQHVLSRAS